MAADEMLMEGQRLETSVPTLRIYFWKEPAISIGYFQDVTRTARRFPSKKIGGGIVRRITGGGLVQHGDDLTFSLTLKDNDPLLPGDVKLSYMRVNEALRAGLKEEYRQMEYADCVTASSARGDNELVCFEKPSRYDLLVDGKKVVGASQRRKDGAILHQSTVYLKEPRPFLTEKIIDGFRDLWGAEFEERHFDNAEMARIRVIEKERYGKPDWASPVIVS